MTNIYTKQRVMCNKDNKSLNVLIKNIKMKQRNKIVGNF
jgi:hypothetical protein